MTNPVATVERMSFHRHPRVPGVEVLSLEGSARNFSCYCVEYEFVAPTTWRGEIRHGKATVLLEPGGVLCLQPGEAFATKRVVQGGSLQTLLIEPATLALFGNEHGFGLSDLGFKQQALLSQPLRAQLDCVFRAFQSECSVLELQTHLSRFWAVAFRELRRPLPSEPSAADANTAARRIRDCLREDHADAMDLDALAGEVGLSKFQALRAFEREFALPPHAYRLRRKLALARRSLRSGMRIADVAAQCGFVDESHLGRHFKRHFGVTPAKYARVGSAAE
jgi:AraC-like DNA-binding protein